MLRSRRVERATLWGAVGTVGCVIAIGLYPPRARAADYSQGGAFLSLGHGARAHALGGAGAALLGDDTAVYWNPANLAWLSDGASLTFMHADVVPEVDDGYSSLSLARAFGAVLGDAEQPRQPTRWGCGFFVSHLGFDFESGAGWGETVVVGGLAYALNNFTSVGVGLKLLLASNDFDSADGKGGGLDLGLSVLVFERLTAALVMRDAWTRVSWDTSTWETLDPGLTLAFDYQPWPRWTALLDLTTREATLQRSVAAVEWNAYRDALLLRGAITRIEAGETRRFASAGAGLRASRYTLDYGASFDDGEALDIGHRVSLRYGF